MTIEIANLTDLKTEIDAWAKRTIGTQVDKFIALAEKRIMRALAKNGLQDKLIRTKTITAAATMSLPAGTRAIEALYIDINPKRVLNYMPPAKFFSTYLSNETGKPTAYTIQGKVVHLGPSPDDTYSVECWFRQQLNIQRTLDQQLIPEQSEAEYTSNITPGTGHAVGDVITLASGAAQVTVEAQSGGGVTEFTLTEVDHTSLVSVGDTLTQSGSSGSGTGFAITLDADNISNLILIDHPELYLYGALIEAYNFYRNREERQHYLGLFEEAMGDLEDEAFNMGGAMQIFTEQASAGAPHQHR